jgi:hypothetical protein
MDNMACVVRNLGPISPVTEDTMHVSLNVNWSALSFSVLMATLELCREAARSAGESENTNEGLTNGTAEFEGPVAFRRR